MAYQLTYTDRSSLLQTFDSLKVASDKPDEQILKDVGEWAKQLQLRFGFELALTRNVTALSRYLMSLKADHDIMDIARGALLYVLRSQQSRGTKIEGFGLFDGAFICNYAVHEIQTRLGERSTYNPPRLTPTEQKRAEDLFIRFIDNPILEDTRLVEESRNVAQGLANLSSCGLFQRLRRNIDFLSTILLDSGRSREQKYYARAALSYLICEDDAINDSLGIVGYLDDNFIVQLAVDFIEPNREPWLEILDEIVGAWPFLNSLIIDDGSGGCPLSEYMLINSALTCFDLHGKEFPQSILLIAPFTGPTSFLLGFLSVVGLIQKSGQREITEQSFCPGQKVLVDNSAIAEFAGFKFYNGRKMFGLTQYPVRNGHCEPCTHYWPISDLCRLLPAASSRVTRGQITCDLDHSDIPLPAMSYLFDSNKIVQISAVTRRTIVVMPVGIAHDMAKQFTIYGQAIKDVVPMGYHSPEGEIRSWSNRFGEQEPLLIFVSDLDVACSFVEENPARNHVVIVDTTGRNANKTASLNRIQQFSIPSLVVSGERFADSLGLTNDDKVGVWEWSEDDFSSLLWPAQQSNNCRGLITRYERRLQTQASCLPDVRSIPFPLAEQAFEALHQIQIAARKRGDEQLPDMDDIVRVTFGVMSYLLRLAFPLEHGISKRKIETILEELDVIRRRSRYLSSEEQGVTAKAAEALKELFIQLQQKNPKADAIKEIIPGHPGIAIICPDARLCPDFEREYSSLGVRIVSGYSDDNENSEGAIVPGWFRKDRMATLLIPLVANPLYLVLYDIERRWYDDFMSERRKLREKRLAHSSRSKLFPEIERWRKHKPESLKPTTPKLGSGLLDLELIQNHIQMTYKQNVCKSARSDGSEADVPARLVVFSGGAYAFLTEFFKANVVTHLIDGALADMEENAEVKQKPVEQLVPGDALLFHRGSDSDVIRTTADKLLASGVREMSSLWRKSLLEYVNSEGLSSEELWSRLRNSGCPLIRQTIKSWLDNDNIIAPQAYMRDVPLIAKVTGNDLLVRQMDEVLTAIHKVRSAHLSASHYLGRQVMTRALNILKEEGQNSAFIELESNVIWVRILEIDSQPTLVRVSLANRLLEGNQWSE